MRERGEGGGGGGGRSSISEWTGGHVAGRGELPGWDICRGYKLGGSRVPTWHAVIPAQARSRWCEVIAPGMRRGMVRYLCIWWCCREARGTWWASASPRGWCPSAAVGDRVCCSPPPDVRWDHADKRRFLVSGYWMAKVHRLAGCASSGWFIH